MIIYLMSKNGRGYHMIDEVDEYLIYEGTPVSFDKDGYVKKGRTGLHRIILQRMLHPKSIEGMFCDHINGNRADNRRCNLRLCSISENNRNVKKNRGKSSYKGVSWNKRTNKWSSQIQYNKKLLYLGLFEEEVDAAIAYNIAAVVYFGTFANLNKV